MKIGIVTLGDYDNYGNRLQNVALSWFLSKEFHADVQTILNWKNFDAEVHIRNLHEMGWFIRRVNFKYIHMKLRRKAFVKFSKKYTREYLPKDPMDRYDLKSAPFDKLVLGSDQVWNFTWQEKSDTDYFMLTGVEPSKRVAYAASLGNPPILSEFENTFGDEIRKFRALSVREAAAQKYLEEKFSVQAEVMPDPTLLVTRQEWNSILNLEEPKSEHYILTYFLGTMSTPLHKSIIKLSREKNLKVINLLGLKWRDIRYYTKDPKEFIEFIMHADYLFTDSFHACVFASVFGTKLIVDNSRDGGKMSSRMETLFQTLNITPNYYTKTLNYSELQAADIDEVNKMILTLKQRASHFLENALK